MMATIDFEYQVSTVTEVFAASMKLSMVIEEYKSDKV